MIQRAVVGLAFAAVAAVALAATVPYPSGATSEDDPRVVAFYAGQCKQWADQQGLSGQTREGFLAKCQANMPKVLPVGLSEGQGGGGE